MAGTRLTRGLVLVIVLAVLTAPGCSRNGHLHLSALSDSPVVVAARLRNLKEYAPGYGIAMRKNGAMEFVVNIEAGDSDLVSSGQQALAYVLPSTAPVHCRVAVILRRVSSETGQSIAWLKPLAPTRARAGHFIDAKILTRVRHGVLCVPSDAVLIKDGQTWVIRASSSGAAEETVYAPDAVRIGAVSDGFIEIESGLNPGDAIVAKGGIGYLYPDFKAAQD
ncbi:MAG: efflux RND transporter periplasmic adaptor subunit [Elusimicrobiota bacterium]